MKRLVWGMLIGIVAIAISSVLAFYVVPLWTGARLPLRSVAGEWVTVHFPAGSPVAEDPLRYIADREEELAALARTVGVARAELPARINLFVHNSEAGLGAILAQRTNPRVTLVFRAAVDVIFGEDTRVPFIQLIGDFAIGENHSRLLRHGIIEYIRAQGRNHHLPVAALPPVLHLRLEEMLALDGRFPLTHYQLFNSPHAAAAIAGLDGLAQLSELQRRVDPDLMNMAVSFVAFLSERFGGPERLIKLWRAGSVAANVQAVYGHSLAELDQAWKERLAAFGPRDEGWAAARGRGLIRVGRLDEALSLLTFAHDDHSAGGALAGEIAREIGWINLLAGEWGEARRQFRQAHAVGVDTSRELRHAELFADWETAEAGSVRIHRAPGLSTDPAPLRELAIAHDGHLQWMRDRMALDATSFPDRAIIFLGAAGEGGIATDLRAGIVAVATPQDVDRSLAELVAFHLWRDQTLSPILRAGLIRYISAPQEDHLARLRNLLRTEAWIPLWLLDFSNFPARYVEPQAASMVAYLLENYDVSKFHTLWQITSPLGGGRSIDIAMAMIYGYTRRGLDEHLRRSWF